MSSYFTDCDANCVRCDGAAETCTVCLSTQFLTVDDTCIGNLSNNCFLLCFFNNYEIQPQMKHIDSRNCYIVKQ